MAYNGGGEAYKRQFTGFIEFLHGMIHNTN